MSSFLSKAPSPKYKMWDTAKNYHDAPEYVPHVDLHKRDVKWNHAVFAQSMADSPSSLTRREWLEFALIAGTASYYLDAAYDNLLHMPVADPTAHDKATLTRLKAIEAAMEAILYAMDDLKAAIEQPNKEKK